jgi:thioredoxin-like negative regulator of GroEL
MTTPAPAVSIRDVGPRDGLQPEKPVDVGFRAWLASSLAEAGVRDVEAAAFVSPRAVPSMAGAAEVLAALDPALAKDPAIERAGAALALAKHKPDEGELAALRAAAAERPADMEAQLAFANAAFAAGDRDAAADTLLRMVAADREWNEGAARAKLLQMFEAIGLEDAWVAATRRRLSTVLFG